MRDAYDNPIANHLYENRILYLSGEIKTDSAAWLVSRLLVLDAIDPKAEIKLYLTSFGGSVYAGLAIYDAMRLVSAPVSTTVFGAACSMAALLLAAGAPGRRFATENARIMLHQGSMGLQGTTSDIRVAADNLLDIERRMNAILARHTGRPPGELERLIQRDLWLGPEQAIELGIIDAVLPVSADHPTR